MKITGTLTADDGTLILNFEGTLEWAELSLPKLNHPHKPDLILKLPDSIELDPDKTHYTLSSLDVEFDHTHTESKTESKTGWSALVHSIKGWVR